MTQILDLTAKHQTIKTAIDDVARKVAYVPSSAKPSQLQAAADLMGNLVTAGDILRGGPDMTAVARHGQDLRDSAADLHRNASLAMVDKSTQELAQYLERINRAATVIQYGSVAAAPKPWLNKIGGLLLGLLVGGGGAAYFAPSNGEFTSPDASPQPAALNTISSAPGGATVQPAAVQGTSMPQQGEAPPLNTKRQGY